MPKLNEYISVGFCSGYGDGDYRVGMGVGKLSRERMNELTVAMVHAQRTAWEIWLRAQSDDQAAATAEASDDL